MRTFDRRKDHRSPHIIDRLKTIQPKEEKELNLIEDVVGEGFKQNEPDYSPAKPLKKTVILGQDKRKFEQS